MVGFSFLLKTKAPFSEIAALAVLKNTAQSSTGDFGRVGFAVEAHPLLEDLLHEKLNYSVVPRGMGCSVLLWQLVLGLEVAMVWCHIYTQLSNLSSS